MHKRYSAICAMMIVTALTCSPTGAQAQNTINRNRDEALEMSYSQLRTALQGHPESLKWLEKSQAAWVRYRDLDAAAIEDWPKDAKDQNEHESARTWKGRLTEVRTLRLREQFTRLPEAERLKARPPWPATERALANSEFTTMTRGAMRAKLGLGPLYGSRNEQESIETVGWLDLDLNQDGEPEVIVKEYPKGLASESYHVYQKPRTGGEPYTAIGAMYGNDLKLLARDNQHYQLQVDTARDRSSQSYALKLYRFQRVHAEPDEDSAETRGAPERYQVVRVDLYLSGEYIFSRPAISED